MMYKILNDRYLCSFAICANSTRKAKMGSTGKQNMNIEILRFVCKPPIPRMAFCSCMKTFVFELKQLSDGNEKVMQDYNQHRNGRSLHKYCKDEAVDYDWLLAFKKNYPFDRTQSCPSSPAGFIPLLVSEERVVVKNWQVEQLLKSPSGETLEMKSNNLLVVSELRMLNN